MAITSKGDDRVGAAHGPEHTSLFNPGADHSLATGFDDAGTNEQIATVSRPLVGAINKTTVGQGAWPGVFRKSAPHSCFDRQGAESSRSAFWNSGSFCQRISVATEIPTERAQHRR